MQASLAERERELGQAREELGERDRRLKEVEIKLLSATQELAANAADYAQRMRDKEEELDQYKVSSARAHTTHTHEGLRLTMPTLSPFQCI